MNRAEYRRQAKKMQKKEKQITLSYADISKLKDEAVEQASNTAFYLLLSLPLIVLRDKYGFGKKRLEKFENELITQYRCFSDGDITLDELQKILYDETGMIVKTSEKFEVFLDGREK